MNPLLTVRENILHSAMMRLPSSISIEEKNRLVSSVISVLDLTKKEHVIVGDLGGRSSLSGGQRKRVSVGIELVMCPSLLFLDEPTSGLDSKSALSLISVLKDVASLGVNVIAVIHQPRYEILQACNNLLVLADGKIKYMGSPALKDLSLVFPRLKPNASGEYPLNGANAADLLVDYIDEFTWNPYDINSMVTKVR
jgi:ABC-type multidrug transport system ATPase subunit